MLAAPASPGASATGIWRRLWRSMRKRHAFRARLQKRTAGYEREPVPLGGSRLFLWPGPSLRQLQKHPDTSANCRKSGMKLAFEKEVSRDLLNEDKPLKPIGPSVDDACQ